MAQIDEEIEKLEREEKNNALCLSSAVCQRYFWSERIKAVIISSRRRGRVTRELTFRKTNQWADLNITLGIMSTVLFGRKRTNFSSAAFLNSRRWLLTVTPRSRRRFSGTLNLRMPKHLHRQLAEEAAQEGISLNQWINAKLAASQWHGLLPLKKGRRAG